MQHGVKFASKLMQIATVLNTFCICAGITILKAVLLLLFV